jgi:hypothetical protein
VGHLEERLEAHENVIHDQLRALETKVEERLATVKGLLSVIVSKLVSQFSSKHEWAVSLMLGN